MKKLKYPSINGLRAISILLVLCNHLTMRDNLFAHLSSIKLLMPLLAFLLDGQLGVNVFFVISGFLITSLMIQEEEVENKISLKSFYIRRTLRIFPAYYFLLLVYFILQVFNFIHIGASSWLTAITYTKYFNWHNEWLTSHAWSLSIEEHFYLLWPLVFISGKIFRKRFALLLILLVPVIRVFIYFFPISWLNEFTIFLRIDAIAIGCLFAIYKDEVIKKMSAHWLKLFLTALLFLFFLRYGPLLAAKINMGFIFIPLGVTHGTIANLLIATIMMYSVFGPKGIWFKILNNKIVNYIGLLSYSIYLWQQFFFNPNENLLTHFPINIICIFFMAVFSYHLIELPFLKLKSKFSVTKS